MSNHDRMEVMKRVESQASTHKCPECQSNTYCSMEDGKSGSLCWCMNVQPNKSFDYDVCVCKNCLSGN